jgi:hypothetical protein
MPTWAVVTVIVGWIIGWPAIGHGASRHVAPDRRDG